MITYSKSRFEIPATNNWRLVFIWMVVKLFNEDVRWQKGIWRSHHMSQVILGNLIIYSMTLLEILLQQSSCSSVAVGKSNSLPWHNSFDSLLLIFIISCAIWRRVKWHNYNFFFYTMLLYRLLNENTIWIAWLILKHFIFLLNQSYNVRLVCTKITYMGVYKYNITHLVLRNKSDLFLNI